MAVEYQNTTITVTEGDITLVHTDAIATLINSGGLWFGGLDTAIQRRAGNVYHSIAHHIGRTQGLRDGQVVYAYGPAERSWPFRDVIFVVDDLHMQLNDLVYIAVEEAYQKQCESVSLPLMRTGVMRNAVEPVEQVPMLMVNGIQRAVDLYGSGSLGNRMAINIVAYSDRDIANAIVERLQSLT